MGQSQCNIGFVDKDSVFAALPEMAYLDSTFQVLEDSLFAIGRREVDSLLNAYMSLQITRERDYISPEQAWKDEKKLYEIQTQLADFERYIEQELPIQKLNAVDSIFISLISSLTNEIAVSNGFEVVLFKRDFL